MEKKYQIFISSTHEDLKEERKRTQDTIFSMHQLPVGMEVHSTADEEQWKIIREVIEGSDYYVLIIGYKYGSVIEEGEYAGISYTQKEFRYALEKNVPVLAFFIDDSVLITPEKIEEDADSKNKLEKFKDEVKNVCMIQWWKDTDDLANKVKNALNEQISRKDRPGWIRIQCFETNDVQRNIVELNKAIKELDEYKEEFQKKITNYNKGREQIIRGNGKGKVMIWLRIGASAILFAFFYQGNCH
ncbi:MAG: DUF4062 domain-containing protein [Lachnospiraceae bacterium]|nr:DUF4062 domain-containing protein [Lachnospiraceae bacterium]